MPPREMPSVVLCVLHHGTHVGFYRSQKLRAVESKMRDSDGAGARVEGMDEMDATQDHKYIHTYYHLVVPRKTDASVTCGEQGDALACETEPIRRRQGDMETIHDLSRPCRLALLLACHAMLRYLFSRWLAYEVLRGTQACPPMETSSSPTEGVLNVKSSQEAGASGLAAKANLLVSVFLLADIRCRPQTDRHGGVSEE